jgi:anti-sigma factor RsiW
MSGKLQISDVELHAFIDGELDARRLGEVEAGIAADPALAERVAAFRADKTMLKHLFGPLIDRPVPEEWLKLAQAPKPRPATRWLLAGSIAAAIVVAVAGTIAYREIQPSRSGEVVEAALDARGAAEAEQVLAVTGDARQYDALLSNTVGSKVRVPDLARLGYRLASIRLYRHAAGSGAAELLYHDRDDRLFTLYLRRSGGTARFDQFERNGLRVCVWQDEELSTVMAGNVSTAAMQRLASLAYSGLTL